jgi:hypothetical protein
VQNKPTTISPEQAAAIESNSQKNSYPQTAADKLATIEENATVGADWETNVQNKPVIFDTLGAAFEAAGVTGVEFESGKKHLKLVFTTEDGSEIEKKIALS